MATCAVQLSFRSTTDAIFKRIVKHRKYFRGNNQGLLQKRQKNNQKRRKAEKILWKVPLNQFN